MLNKWLKKETISNRKWQALLVSLSSYWIVVAQWREFELQRPKRLSNISCAVSLKTPTSTFGLSVRIASLCSKQANAIQMIF